MSVVLPVESISDTAFVTAYCRALESERPDAHFLDPYAHVLAGGRGQDLLHGLPGWELTAAGCIVRTYLLDRLLLQTIQEATVDTVINLGAGLDTRPYRLELPPSLCWIEVDEAGVLTYKARKLQSCRPVCTLQSLPLNLTDIAARQTLFRSIAAKAEAVLVITEGLLVYLRAQQVTELARDIERHGQFQWWLTDLVSAHGFRWMKKATSETPSLRGVDLLFAPEEGPEFFARYGWEIADICSCLPEAQRLNRLFLAEAFLSAPSTREQRELLEKLFAVIRLKRMTLQSDR